MKKKKSIKLEKLWSYSNNYQVKFVKKKKRCRLKQKIHIFDVFFILFFFFQQKKGVFCGESGWGLGARKGKKLWKPQLRSRLCHYFVLRFNSVSIPKIGSRKMLYLGVREWMD